MVPYNSDCLNAFVLCQPASINFYVAKYFTEKHIKFHFLRPNAKAWKNVSATGGKINIERLENNLIDNSNEPILKMIL